MHVKTALQMLNAVDKIETTDLTGKHLKEDAEKVIIDTIKNLFPELELNYIPGKGFSTELNSIHKENKSY